MTEAARNINIDYQPLPSAADFHNSNARVKAYMGPMGSGKSTAAIEENRFLMEESKVPLRFLVLRESFRQLNDSTRKTFEEWFPEPVSHWNETGKKYLVTWPNIEKKYLTHEFHFRHARRAQEASNLLSTEYAGIWLEEPVPAFQMTDGIMGAGLPKEFFTLALGRQRQRGAPRYTIILTFNPPPMFHWCYEMFVKPPKAQLEKMGFELFRSPPNENKKNLPEGYYETLRAIWPDDMIDRFIDGKCITLYPGKPVFTEFNEQLHFRDAKDLKLLNLPMVLALDFGLTPCALFCQITSMGQLRIYRELQMRSSGAIDLAEAIRDIMKNEFPGLKIRTIWGDPAGQDESQSDRTTPFQKIRAILDVPVQPGDQRIFTRLESVRARAKGITDGDMAIVIAKENCMTLMEGLLGAYRYPASQNGLIGAKPLKNMFSHLADALQYLCTGEFNVVSGETTRAQDDEEKPISIPKLNPLASVVGKRNTGRSWMGG